MELQQQINQLEKRQLELGGIMAKSDAHAAKCTKRGLNFEETYPEDLAEYNTANTEYNANQVTLAELYRRREQEEDVRPVEPTNSGNPN